MTPTGDPLGPARHAVETGDFDIALERLAASGPVATTAAGIELRAHASYGVGDFEGAVAAWEDLHSLQQGAGNHLGAGEAAAMVAMYLMMDTGLMAPVRGWLGRAERLVADLGETHVHALVAMVRTYERLMCGDLDAAADHAELAIDTGTRHGVQPAVIIGRVAQARVEIFEGRIEQGLEMLDDIAVTLLSGEVDSLTTGMALCELICAMQGLAMYERAAEWTQAMEQWRHGTAFGGINGRCRVHRAEMLRISGPCDEAEEEALQACEELRPWMRREFGWPLAELGNIRLRKGDLVGAEEAFLAAHQNAWTPQPGLALLRLAQGDVATAVALIDDAVAHPFEVPSKERPPFGELRRAPLLDAQIEIAAAAGNVETARRASDELLTIATTFRSEALLASAALGEARTALLEGETRRAIAECGRAVSGWTEVGAPFEAAVARMVLGEAQQQLGNEQGARLEWQAARSAFEEFGAELWARQAADRLGGAPAPGADPPAVPAPVAGNVFRCEGDTRTVTFNGTTVLLRDLVGLRYLERLLAEPGREFHALDLVAVERGSLPTSGPVDPELVAVTSDAGVMLDDQAREAYRRRLQEVDDDIDEATRMNDPERVALAERDREYLINELSRAVGLGGRARKAGDTAERARTSVTRSIRYALTKIGEHHPTLADHLRQTVSTGTYCVYSPDSRIPVDWKI